MREVLFFCSAIKDINEKYNQAARQAVRAACLAGYDIASGGTVKGMMGIVCDEASKYGVHVRGVLPRFMQGLENPHLNELSWTDTMSERKEAMRAGSYMAVALPGGIGTLDELSETYCLAKMGLYDGHVVVLNLDGFYDGYRLQLETCVREGMLPAESMNKIKFVSSVEEFTELL